MDSHHETIRYTADVVVLRHDGNGRYRVLLIQRHWDPYAGSWALPGGHVDRSETARQAAARELREETGIHLAEEDLVEIGVFDAPDRDPRGRYVTVAFSTVLDFDHTVEPTAGDDAADVAWKPIDATAADLAFDHATILAAATPASASRFD